MTTLNDTPQYRVIYKDAEPTTVYAADEQDAMDWGATCRPDATIERVERINRHDD